MNLAVAEELSRNKPNLFFLIRPYAESIVRRLKPTGMIMEFNVLKSESELQKAIDELTRMKVPYAVILGAQNEIHRSLTLNILHGTPQGNANYTTVTAHIGHSLVPFPDLTTERSPIYLDT